MYTKFSLQAKIKGRWMFDMHLNPSLYRYQYFFERISSFDITLVGCELGIIQWVGFLWNVHTVSLNQVQVIVFSRFIL